MRIPIPPPPLPAYQPTLPELTEAFEALHKAALACGGINQDGRKLMDAALRVADAMTRTINVIEPNKQ